MRFLFSNVSSRDEAILDWTLIFAIMNLTELEEWVETHKKLLGISREKKNRV